MLPYAFSRLKAKKIVLDPLFKDLLNPNFSNDVLKSVFDSEKAAAMNFALPRPWSAESLSSLSPFDLLFHYTVNTLQPLLGLKAEKESYDKSVRVFLALGSYMWKVAYYLRFEPNVFTHELQI